LGIPDRILYLRFKLNIPENPLKLFEQKKYLDSCTDKGSMRGKFLKYVEEIT
jgi:hypothetical protein